MAMQPSPAPADPGQDANPRATVASPAPAETALAAAAAAEGALVAPYIPPVNFWQHPFVQNVLPFLTSLILHLSLIIIGVLTLTVYTTVVLNPNKEQLIIPESDMPMEGADNGILNPGAGNDPSREAFQDKFQDVSRESKGLAEKRGTTLLPALIGGGSGDSEGGSLIAAGAGGLGVGSTFGSGKGSGTGSGTGDGSGVLAPFGIPGGGAGIAPRASFIGSRGAARRIAYVCDASGSMMTMFDLLRYELEKSITNLAPIQSFNVIFFQDEGVATAERGGLMVANPDNKRKTFDFLRDFSPRGTTNPLPSLELAFRQEPELIYLLTDGEFPDNNAVLEFCRKRNAAKKTKINTLAFINKDVKDTSKLEYVKILQQLAKENGGLCRLVSEDDMGQR